MLKLQIALFFADGRAFFVGAVCIMASTLVAIRPRNARRGVLIRALAGSGVLLVALSSTPLHPLVYVVWGLAMLAWCITLVRCSGTVGHRAATAFCFAISLGAVALELPHRRLPTLELTDSKTVYVIGDSLSAGMGLGEQTWPKALRLTGNVDVVDLSRAGATVASALRQAQQIRSGSAIVLVEIGGNDLLGTTTAREYELNLGALLSAIKKDGRRIVMFELPLPPFSYTYGRVQRRLAREFEATMLPKWVLARVIGSDQTTLDGLHLSNSGHELMAQTLREVLPVAAAAATNPS